MELALDAVFGGVPVPAPGPDWRADVLALMSGWRRAMLGHPWSAAVLGGRPLLGPNVLARTDFLYARLAGLGLSGARLATAAYSVANYVIGSALMEVGARGQDAAGSRAPRSTSPATASCIRASPNTAISVTTAGTPRSPRAELPSRRARRLSSR